MEVAAGFVTPVEMHGTLVYSHRTVAKHYLSGELVGDVLCRFPWQWLFEMVQLFRGAGASGCFGAAQLPR
eukprot:6503393-Prymnesium_polylepis.1